MKRITSLILVTMLVVSLFAFVGCEKADDFSEEEHLQRISERIEKRIINNSTTYTNFEVYPLYNKDNVLNYFLVEFEPYGFIFVLLKDKEWEVFSWLGISTSMYMISNLYGDVTWSPYTIDETNSQPYPDIDKKWIVDENNNKICYNKSPYYVTQNLNEKKYLLTMETGSKDAQYICAIKRGETFINLISLTEVDIAKGDLSSKQATLEISFIANKTFDL